MNNIFKFIISIALPLAVGAVSSLFTTAEIPGWYAGINKPSWNPPNWLFGPVWTTLYIMMGIALFLVWKAPDPQSLKRTAILFFAIQLTFNFAWSFIFFGLHRTGWALAEIVMLWLFILFTIIWFGKINKTAVWLLVPYFFWVSFATVLNFTIWRLNGGGF